MVHAFEDAQFECGVSCSSDGLGIETCTLGPVAYRDGASGGENCVRECVKGRAQATDPHASDRAGARRGAVSVRQMSVDSGLKHRLNLAEATGRGLALPASGLVRSEAPPSRPDFRCFAERG